jgi:predicted GIY-YIG superfamily endonuclease
MPKKDRRPERKAFGDEWVVYMVRCADGTLYTGIAKDMARRCQQHNAGTASRYTRGRLPVELLYQESLASRSMALKREAAIKALSRSEKLALICLRKKTE